MTATTTSYLPETLLTSGAKRIMGVARQKGITSTEVFELVVRWGQYIDQAVHPEARCGTCSHPIKWNSFENRYVHQDSKHSHCSTHAGRTARV